MMEYLVKVYSKPTKSLTNIQIVVYYNAHLLRWCGGSVRCVLVWEKQILGAKAPLVAVEEQRAVGIVVLHDGVA